MHKRGLLTGGAVIELSQFHLANEGEASSLPFRMLQANNHIETRGGCGWSGVGSQHVDWDQCLVATFVTGVVLLEPHRTWTVWSPQHHSSDPTGQSCLCRRHLKSPVSWQHLTHYRLFYPIIHLVALIFSLRINAVSFMTDTHTYTDTEPVATGKQTDYHI